MSESTSKQVPKALEASMAAAKTTKTTEKPKASAKPAAKPSSKTMSKARTTPKRQDKATKRLHKFGPKAQTSFRKNGLPVVAGIVVMLLIMAALNIQWLVAQYQYRTQGSQNTIAGQVAITEASRPYHDTAAPNPERGPLLTIPAIDVEAPIGFDQGSAEWQIQLALRKGVVHYDNSVAPGNVGNVAIFGHSSGAAWAPGDYKFIFTMLDKLKAGDIAYVDYQGTRYTYRVVSLQVVAPTDVGVLKSADQKELTLITCTPVGTSTNRLVVHAEQVSPNPKAAAQDAPNKQVAKVKPSASQAGATPQELPGSASGSIWQTIKSWF